MNIEECVKALTEMIIESGIDVEKLSIYRIAADIKKMDIRNKSLQ